MILSLVWTSFPPSNLSFTKLLNCLYLCHFKTSYMINNLLFFFNDTQLLCLKAYINKCINKVGQFISVWSWGVFVLFSHKMYLNTYPMWLVLTIPNPIIQTSIYLQDTKNVHLNFTLKSLFDLMCPTSLFKWMNKMYFYLINVAIPNNIVTLLTF